MTVRGSCHCGETQFEVSEAPASLTRCTCSLCAKRGALWGYYTPAQFRLTTPTENVATYRWGSRTVKHHFCASCGCGTYSESPDWSTSPISIIRATARVGAGTSRRFTGRARGADRILQIQELALQIAPVGQH
jgi:hypothetical protein